MDKKVILSVLVIVVAGVVATLFYSMERAPDVFQMSGRVIEVKENSVLIEGRVGQESKMVEFIITPATVLKKSTLVITEEQIRSGKPYSPKVQVVTGQKAELTQNAEVVKAVSLKDLADAQSVEAQEILYLKYDLPQISQ